MSATGPRIAATTLIVVLAIVAALVARCGGTTSTPSAPTPAAAPALAPAPAPQPPSTPQCDASLWSHVYDPNRLQIRDNCRTVTGAITDHHANPDGDIDIRIEVDPQYRDMLNAGNISSLSGHLQTEAICQAPITNSSAASACRGFSGSVKVPPDGTRVQVTGTYLYDTNHGWMELHPISRLKVIE